MLSLRSWNIGQKPAVGTEELPVKQEKTQVGVMPYTPGERDNGVKYAEWSPPPPHSHQNLKLSEWQHLPLRDDFLLWRVGGLQGGGSPSFDPGRMGGLQQGCALPSFTLGHDPAQKGC